jgi:hypothetical protein
LQGGIEFRWSPRPADWGDALRAAVPLYRWAGCYGLVAAAVVGALVPLAARRSFRATPLAGRTVTGHADAHAVWLTVGDEARSVLRWSALPAWSETSRSIVLRTGADVASPVYAVPHRAFADPGDARRFRELLTRHVGPPAR